MNTLCTILTTKISFFSVLSKISRFFNIKRGCSLNKLQITLVKRQWQQVSRTLHKVAAIRAVEQDLKGLATAPLRLNQHLTARTTRTDGNLGEGAVLGTGGYAYQQDAFVGIAGIGIENGRSLGAQTRWVGAVLLVGTAHHLAVVKHNRCTYTEMRVGTVAAESGGFLTIFVFNSRVSMG